MARTYSSDLPLGFKAPDFSLSDTISGRDISLDDLRSDTATVIIFMCNHCPYVIHVIDEIARLAKDYLPKGIRFAGISANDVGNYPEDSPEKMKELGQKIGFEFPYLYDETQEVAKSYDAACTPEFHIFDREMKCVYRGQLDDSRPGNSEPVSGKDVRNALDNLLRNEPVDPNQKQSMGCNIKWKS